MTARRAILVSKTPEEMAGYLAFLVDDYVAARVRAGEDVDSATKGANTQFETFFPNGAPGPGHAACNLVVENQVVGSLWIGPSTHRASQAWVYYVNVDPEHQGKGFGRVAMEAGERWALEQGFDSIGLNVFGDNTVARQLYTSLGYEPSAIQMRKSL